MSMHEPEAGPQDADEAGPTALDFYWRPGCPFCMSLRRSLKRRGIPLVLHNIWADREAAETVRSVAKGTETVPTIAVGGQALVNPTPKAVEKLLAHVAPELLALADSEREGRRSWFSRLRGSN